MASIKKPVKKVKHCRCDAYKFPHRLDSGACRELYNQESTLPMDNSDDWKYANSTYGGVQ